MWQRLRVEMPLERHIPMPNMTVHTCPPRVVLMRMLISPLERTAIRLCNRNNTRASQGDCHAGPVKVQVASTNSHPARLSPQRETAIVAGSEAHFASPLGHGQIEAATSGPHGCPISRRLPRLSPRQGGAREESAEPQTRPYPNTTLMRPYLSPAPRAAALPSHRWAWEGGPVGRRRRLAWIGRPSVPGQRRCRR